jgi:hypothetical protein
MKIKLKSQDEKLKQLKIMQWGKRFYTLDEQIPGIKEKNQVLLERNTKEYAGEQSPFTPNAKKASRDVIFGSKMKEKDVIKTINMFSPRSPRELIVSDVYYTISDKIVFINFFTDIKYVKEELNQDLTQALLQGE